MQFEEDITTKEMMNFTKEQAAYQQADSMDDHLILQQQKEREDLLRWQQDMGDETQSLKRILLGGFYNDDGKWIQVEEPLMNVAGFRMVESTAKPLLSRNLINSNLDDRTIYMMLRFTCDKIVHNITLYGESHYGMEFGNYSFVLRIIKNTIIPTPFRAKNGWNKKQDNMMSKRVEAFNESQSGAEPKKKSVWSMFS